MNDKHQNIVEAARRMFSRYGFSKTTMADIAKEAGVSRQTVYNVFPGKDEILRAAVRVYAEHSKQQIMTAWSGSDTIDARIDDFHQLGPVTWFQAVREAPDWADLIEGMHKAAAEELAQNDQHWIEVLRVAFAETTEWDKDDATLNEIVEFFYFASANAKLSVTDLAHLQRRLRTIKAATLALLKAGGTED